MHCPPSRPECVTTVVLVRCVMREEILSRLRESSAELGPCRLVHTSVQSVSN
ncbi:MAG: hypothetical protein J07HX64_02083 [halophilic archaeon J07HX64]|nr:MAG: hypothetical protein J07HX64_02083 [halophilic archaeon J07HX64]